jgi:DNA polymerase III epsilon subunit-like protein
MKFCFVDVEGSEGKIWQFSAILEVDGKIVEELNSGGSSIDKYPLSQSFYYDFQEVLKEYINPYDRNDKAFFIGYNAGYDAHLVREWFKSEDDVYFGSWFWHPPLDVMMFANLFLAEERHKVGDFKLGTVCRYMGIDFAAQEAHDAEYDVTKTRELFYKLVTEGMQFHEG